MIFLLFQSHIKANLIMKTTQKFLPFLLLILWSYNASSYTLTNPIPPLPPTANSDPIQAEKDEMLSLAVLQMVYKDWQAVNQR